MEEWRRELDELVERGRAELGDDEVRHVLAEAIASLVSAEPSPLAPPVPVLGAAACDAGWVGVLVRSSGQTSLHVGGSIHSLIEQVREQESLGAVGLADPDREDAVAWLRSRPTVQVVETAELDGSGSERRQRLVAEGVTIPAMYSGMGFEESDLLTACEAAVRAARLWF